MSINLTEKTFWAKWVASAPSQKFGRRRGLRALFDRSRLRVGAEPCIGVGLHAARKLLQGLLPPRPDFSVLEVGCTPGRHLLWWNRLFGYQPYGVEYTANGVEVTRTAFREAGLPAGNVIHADFFDKEFQARYRERFDVVFSLGFIEHFKDAAHVVQLQVDLLKQGGYLVCWIPNLLGLSLPILKLCGQEFLDAHNCSIMNHGVFRRLFSEQSLRTLYCGPCPGLTFYGKAFFRQRGSLQAGLARLLGRIEDAWDHFVFLIHRGRAILPLTSAYLFVGQLDSARMRGEPL